MPEVHISSHDNNIEKDLRNFKRKVDKAGLPTAVRENMSHTKPTAERKRAKAAAVKRWDKKLKKEREAMVRMIRSRLSKRNKKTNSLVERVKAERAEREES